MVAEPLCDLLSFFRKTNHLCKKNTKCGYYLSSAVEKDASDQVQKLTYSFSKNKLFSKCEGRNMSAIAFLDKEIA